MSYIVYNGKRIVNPSGKYITGIAPIIGPTDYNGNTYSAVSIGSQIWTVESLISTNYIDGAPIPNVTNQAEWDGLTTGAYCWYNNDESSYKNPYGALYNWYAVDSINGLAPFGWRVPTQSDWETLSTYLGGSLVAGGKLKQTGLDYWSSPNAGATNETGFTAFPGGLRNIGFFNLVGFYFAAWSSTSTGATTAYSIDCGFGGTNLNPSSISNKAIGFSIRLIKE